MKYKKEEEGRGLMSSSPGKITSPPPPLRLFLAAPSGSISLSRSCLSYYYYYNYSATIPPSVRLLYGGAP